MKKYQILMTGICSLALVFGLILIACKNDEGGGGGMGGLVDQAVGGRGGGNSNTVPAAPASITAFVASETSITVSWSAVSGASGYKVYRWENDAGDYRELAETDKVSYTNQGLSPNTPYSYRVSAYNNKGEGTQSSTADATILTGVNSLPAAPTGVKATRISEGEVYVTWNPVAGATMYLVYWAEYAEGPWALDGTKNEPAFTSKNWEGYDYGYFKISAVNPAGEGPQSAYVRFGAVSEGSSGSAPSVPQDVQASASSSSSITVTWSPVSGASGYRVYRSMGSTLGESSFSFQANVTSPSYSDTDVHPSTTYYYQIVAYNDNGESSQSTAASASPQVGALSAPSGIYVSANSSTSIIVNWTEVVGAASYNIYRSEANIYYSYIATVYTRSYTDTGLSPNSTHYYKVTTVNSMEIESSQSSSGFATTWSSGGSSGVALPAPTGVWAYKISSDEVYVYWDSVSGAEKYVIYWASNEDPDDYTFDGEVPGSETWFTSTDWGGFSTAYFKITAVNAAGIESALSDYAWVSLGGSYSMGTVPSMQKKLAIEKR
ncbi:hypothetical protein Holit_00556 [Hollandina sp. SP2]